MLAPAQAAPPERAPTVMHLITGLETGGAETMLARLVAGMDRDRLGSVVVSLTDAGTVGGRIAAADIPLEVLGMRRGRLDPRAPLRLLGLLRRYRPAILQTWLYHADLLGLVAHALGRAPHLVWNIRCSETIEVDAVRSILRRCSRIPEAIVINSMAGLRYHESLGYRPRRWEYLPNGFDTSIWRPGEAARHHLRAELGIDEEAVAIGLSARYHPMKDHPTFFAAAARLAAAHPNVVFVLAGAGIDDANKELTQLIDAHGLRPKVRLLGERGDMPSVYPAFDIATLTSAYGEGFPNVLGEAMACGVPCVTTDSGDAGEIVGPTGELLAPGDAAGLAAAWGRLVTAGPAARRSCGAQSRDRIIERYDLATIIQRFEKFYAGLLNRR
jgi:glycosyltransferase involved in cell wall biosynthesis